MEPSAVTELLAEEIVHSRSNRLVWFSKTWERTKLRKIGRGDLKALGFSCAYWRGCASMGRFIHVTEACRECSKLNNLTANARSKRHLARISGFFYSDPGRGSLRYERFIFHDCIASNDMILSLSHRQLRPATKKAAPSLKAVLWESCIYGSSTLE